MSDSDSEIEDLEQANTLALDMAGPGSPNQSYLERIGQINNARQAIREASQEEASQETDTEPPSGGS